MVCAADAYAKSRLAPYKWHEYNDAHVREIKPEKVCTVRSLLHNLTPQHSLCMVSADFWTHG